MRVPITAFLVATSLAVACGPPPPPPRSTRSVGCPELTEPEAEALLARARADLASDPESLDAALEVANRTESCHPHLPAHALLMAELGAAARARSAALVEAGDFPQARFQLARFAGRLDLAEPLRAVELAWAQAETARLIEDESAGLHASAWVRASLVARLAGDEPSMARRDSARQRWLAQGLPAVDLGFDADPALVAALEWALGVGLSPVLRWTPGSGDALLEGRLRSEGVVCEERSVVAVVERSSSDPDRARALEERREAEARLAEARRALELAAEGDRRLRAGLELLETGASGRRDEQRLEAAEIRAVIAAREALEALVEPPAAPAPLRLEQRVHTRTCRLAAELTLLRPEGAPNPYAMEAEASCDDTSHPALLEAGITEDPLRYPQTEQDLSAAAAAELVGRLGRLLEERATAVGAIAEPPPGSCAPEVLESVTAAGLLRWRLDGGAPSPALRAHLSTSFGVEDADLLRLPDP